MLMIIREDQNGLQTYLMKAKIEMLLQLSKQEYSDRFKRICYDSLSGFIIDFRGVKMNCRQKRWLTYGLGIVKKVCLFRPIVTNMQATDFWKCMI